MTCAACSTASTAAREAQTVADARSFANGRAGSITMLLSGSTVVAEVESLGYVVIDDGSGDEAELAVKPTSGVSWLWRRSSPSRPS